jgi:hypothetical protein
VGLVMPTGTMLHDCPVWCSIKAVLAEPSMPTVQHSWTPGQATPYSESPPSPEFAVLGTTCHGSGAFGDPPAPRDAVAVVVTAGVPCGLDGEQPEGSVVSSTVAIAEVVILTRRGRRGGLGSSRLGGRAASRPSISPQIQA